MDLSLFRSINSLSHAGIGAQTVIIILATWFIWIEGFLLFEYAIRNWPKRKALLAASIKAAGLTWLLAHLIGFFFFRPRPFVALTDVYQLVDIHPMQKSFPSDHAGIAFAIAFSVYLADRKLGRVLLVLATLIAFGRVAAGVHYPSDVVGGMLLGGLVAFGVHRFIHILFRSKHRGAKV